MNETVTLEDGFGGGDFSAPSKFVFRATSHTGYT